MDEKQQASVRDQVVQLEQRRLIRIRQVTEIAACSRSSIFRKIKAGEFPAPVQQDGANTRWLASEVYQYVDDLVRRRDERLAKARAVSPSTSAATA